MRERSARVREVVHARLAVSGQDQSAGQQGVEEGVRVGDVDDVRVLADLGEEGPWVQVWGDGHAEAQDQGVGVGGEQGLDVRFRQAVEGGGEVWWGGFGVGCWFIGAGVCRGGRVHGVLGVVGIDAWRIGGGRLAFWR